ncbi:hypothetical protein [Paenibacillus pini]|uniref:Uncharacterized protein n=1 Tax=Paenibacillus pini JCM 16418 TaxID=1236976 RepID=W7YRF3_9BACL|nr:hypothetical protein [Paenibacillus pini]GAF10018.1 hypothetical protein JCM16418_4188 [Paenibacillus pini JCM 16418]
MRRRRGKDFIFLGLMIVLIGFIVFEGYRLMRPQSDRADAGQMLFEVAHFQMQILSTSLLDATNSTHTDQLNGLKLAAYSAAYSHQRLASVFGASSLNQLSAIADLVNLISEWQIGGDRPLSEQDRKIIRQYSEKFGGVLPVYQQLMSASGHVISSQDDDLERINKELSLIVKNK